MGDQLINNIWNSSYEWKSKTEVLGIPFIHIAIGRNRETGKFLVAKGIIAIGQFAIGIIAIGQFAVGLLFGLAQLALGVFVVAQIAIGYEFALGQFAVGMTAIGQFAIGKYVLCQTGYGQYVWSFIERNTEALEYFKHLIR